MGNCVQKLRRAVTRRTLPPGIIYHLFFVYSSEDGDYVKEKVKVLEQPPYNLRCCFSDRDFIPGVPLHENINVLMLRSLNIILVLSPDFFESGWCLQEERIAHALSCSNSTGVISLVHKPCDIPERLVCLSCIDDTTGENVDKKLLEAALAQGAVSSPSPHECNCQVTGKVSIDEQLLVKARKLPEGKSYHIFFVYHYEDATFVHERSKALENPPYNLSCCFSDRNFIPGMPLTDNIDNLMLRSMSIVMILSPDFFQSGWCRYEERLAHSLSARRGTGIIHVLHRPCELPPRMKAITYIDETVAEEVDKRIAYALSRQRGNGDDEILELIENIYDKECDSRLIRPIPNQDEELQSNELDRTLPEGKDFHFVFIACAKDYQFAFKTSRALESASYNVKCHWLSILELPVTEIVDEISRSLNAVLIVSPDAFVCPVTDFCHRFAFNTYGIETRVIPLVHKSCLLPVWMMTVAYIDLSNEEDIDKKIQEAVRSLGTMPATVTTNDSDDSVFVGLDNLPQQHLVCRSTDITPSGEEDPYAIYDRTLPYNMEFHLFLAHCHEDTAYAIERIETLESPPYNLRCCLGVRDFMPGETILSNIADFSARSLNAVLILSPAFFESEWCRVEQSVVEEFRVRNGMGIIPVVYKPCAIPSRLASLNYLTNRPGCDIDRQIAHAVFAKQLFNI